MKKILLSLVGMVLATVAIAQIPISSLPNANLPLTGAEQTIVNQSGQTRKTTVSSFGGLFPPLNATYILQSPNAGVPNSRTLVGTANEILLADGGPLGNLVLSTPQPIATTSIPTFAGMTLNGGLSGTSANFSGTLGVTGLLSGTSANFSGTLGVTGLLSGVNATFSGTLTANSLSLTTPLPATSGGTGFGSYAVGDLLSASTTTALSKISDVAAGSYLRSGGASTLPLYSTVKIPNTDALGDIWVASATNTVTALAGNITTTKNFLTQTGTGAVSASPAWGTIAASDLPGTFSGFANPTATVGLTAVNGVATTALRSDSAPPLSQAIVPTWTGVHTFSATPNLNLGFAGTYNLNTTKQNVLSNTSTGVAATHSIGVNNGTDTFQMGLNGVNNVTPFFTGGPASVQGYFGTIAATPLSFGTNGLERFRVATTGGMVMNAPTSGQTLAITSIANQDALAVLAPNTSGQSFGMIVTAGTTSADESARFRNAAGTTEFLVRGDGALQGNGPVAGTLVDMTPDQGSFTGTYTGMTTTNTCTVRWNRIGAIVVLELCAGNGTSNAVTFTMTGLPAAIVPANQKVMAIPQAVDNSTTTAGVTGVIQAAGTTVIFSKQGASSGWTASGTKSMFDGTILTYTTR